MLTRRRVKEWERRRVSTNHSRYILLPLAADGPRAVTTSVRRWREAIDKPGALEPKWVEGQSARDQAGSRDALTAVVGNVLMEHHYE